jgi:hypothetical protein
MDDIPCSVCPHGELEITETRRHLHCAICGHYELIEDDDYDKED